MLLIQQMLQMLVLFFAVGKFRKKKMLMDNVSAEVSKYFPHFHKTEEIWFIRLKVCAERRLVGENDEEPI